MHHGGTDVVEHLLIVGNHYGAGVGLAELIESLGHDAEGVDVETGVGLVQDGELRLEHGHLEYLIALALSAAEALVDTAAGELAVHAHHLALLAHELEKLGRVHLRQALILALGIDGCAHEVDHTHARYLHRLLKREEYSLVAACIGREGEHVLAVEGNGALRDLILRIAGEHIAERRLAAAVGPHKGMHFTIAHGEIHSPQYLFIAYRSMQIAYFKHILIQLLYSQAGLPANGCKDNHFRRLMQGRGHPPPLRRPHAPYILLCT